MSSARNISGLIGSAMGRGAMPLYADVLEPVGPRQRSPVVMIHGGAHTGECYLRTIDGRPGWGLRFAAAGHPVILPDWPGVGRSGAVPLDRLSGELVCSKLQELIELTDEPVLLITHSMSGAYGWKLLERVGSRVRGLIAIAPGPPGNIQPRGVVTDRRGDEIEVKTPSMQMRFSLTRPVAFGLPFVERKLLATSTRFPRHLIQAYAASLQSIPPRLLYERLNVEESQLKVQDPSRIVDQKILIVTGTEDSEHPRELDGMTADWLREQGADVEFRFLADVGVHGNGHMLMLEDNSDALAAMLVEWADGL